MQDRSRSSSRHTELAKIALNWVQWGGLVWVGGLGVEWGRGYSPPNLPPIIYRAFLYIFKFYTFVALPSY